MRTSATGRRRTTRSTTTSTSTWSATDAGPSRACPQAQPRSFVAGLEADFGFRTDISHVSVHGLCASCKDRDFEPEADDPL